MRRKGIAVGVILAALVVFVAPAGWAGPPRLRVGEMPARPKILGIAGGEIISSDVAASSDLAIGGKVFPSRPLKGQGVLGPYFFCTSSPFILSYESVVCIRRMDAL
jgi:hypothetical protein